MTIISIGQRHHSPALAVAQQLDCQTTKGKAHHSVHGIGFAGSHQIGEFLDNGANPGFRFDAPGQSLANPALFAMARGFGEITFGFLAQNMRAFRDYAHGVILAAIGAIFGQERDQPVWVRRDFGNYGAGDLGEIARQ